MRVHVTYLRWVMCVAFLSACTMAQEASATMVSVSPSSSPISIGETVTVDVDINNVSDLYGFQFDLTYNPAVLTAVGSTEGGFLATAGSTFFVPGTIDNTSGAVTATANTLVGAIAGATGSGSLGSFTFYALGAGTTTLSLANVQLLDSNLNPIAADLASASVTVSAVPLPPTGGLFLAGIALFATLTITRRPTHHVLSA